MRLYGIPAGLTNRKCERFDPGRMGGFPPIRFISENPEKDEDDDTKKHNTVKIAISDNVTKVFETFEKGGPEAVIKLIRDHESLVEDRKLRDIYNSASALWNEKKRVLTGLDPISDAAEIDDLKEQIAEHKAMCITTQEEAFDYFEKLLSSENVPKWREIVKEQCDTNPYVDLKGRKMSTISLEDAYSRHSSLVTSL